METSRHENHLICNISDMNIKFYPHKKNSLLTHTHPTKYIFHSYVESTAFQHNCNL